MEIIVSQYRTYRGSGRQGGREGDSLLSVLGRAEVTNSINAIDQRATRSVLIRQLILSAVSVYIELDFPAS